MSGRRLLWRVYPRVACLLIVSLASVGWLAGRFDGLAVRCFVGAALALLAAVPVSWLVTRWLNEPVAQLRAAADHFAAGELDYKLWLPQSVELVKLAETFNLMAERLQERLQALHQRNREQEAVLTSMVEAVLAVDTEQRVISLNAAASRLLGTTSAEAQGRSLQEVVRNADLRRFVASTLECDRPIEGDVVLRNARDSVLQANGTALRDQAGRGIGAVIVLNDVSRLRQLENIRRDFAANVSHELKTPITSIKGFVETLLDGALQNADDAERFLRIIARQADRLNAIIEDLLSLAKIERDGEGPDLALSVAALDEVLEAAWHDCEGPAADRNIRIRWNCPAELRARINAPLLQQAVGNLLDNAIKYSEPGREVELEGRAEGGEVQIVVRDQGCGIAREHLPRLFERFYRVDKARSRKLGGTGLGLAIVKHIVLAHRGQVTVESQPGRGSTFTIRLPAP